MLSTLQATLFMQSVLVCIQACLETYTSVSIAVRMYAGDLQAADRDTAVRQARSVSHDQASNTSQQTLEPT